MLRVEAGVDGLGDGSIARLFLQDGTGASLAKATSLDGLPLWVRAPVVPGPYAVLLQAGGARRLVVALRRVRVTVSFEGGSALPARPTRRARPSRVYTLPRLKPRAPAERGLSWT